MKATSSEHIKSCLNKLGPLTRQQVTFAMAEHNFSSAAINAALTRLMDAGSVALVDGKFILAATAKELGPIEPAPAPYVGEVAGPRITPAFRPIQAKHIPSIDARRNDALPARREFSLKSASPAASDYWSSK